MQTYPFCHRPVWAVLQCLARGSMDVILHIGAHRTGTTSFQAYLRRNAEGLRDIGVGFWGPGQTRQGLFSEIFAIDAAPDTLSTQTVDILRARLSNSAAKGIKTLIVSDENMLGSVRHNIREERLYPAAAERLSKVTEALEGRISRILVSPRSLETYWCSALAYGVMRGASVPARGKLARIAQARRGWRDVISDVAAATQTKVNVAPFEKYKGRADALLGDFADVTAPFDTDRRQTNRSPCLPELRRTLHERGDRSAQLPFGMGRWNPFTNEEHAALRELHADDMMWLTSGADGLAHLIEDRTHECAGPTPPLSAKRKGQFDEFEERQVARPG